MANSRAAFFVFSVNEKKRRVPFLALRNYDMGNFVWKWKFRVLRPKTTMAADGRVPSSLEFMALTLAYEEFGMTPPWSPPEFGMTPPWSPPDGRPDWIGHGCLHGGPSAIAVHGFMSQLRDWTDHHGDDGAVAREGDSAFEGGTAARTSAPCVQQARAEQDSLYAHWKQRRRRSTLTPAASDVCFSIALDASYDGRFATARTHLRLGVFLKLLFDDDGNAHADPFPGASGRTETEWHSQRTIEHGRVLQRIATDVGLLLYLNEKIRCSCLRDPSFRATAAAWYAHGGPTP
jgi:hypothetical protein